MRRYLLDSTPLAGVLRGKEPFAGRVRPLLQNREVATSILVYAEIIEYLKGTQDFDRRREQLLALLHIIHPYFLTYSIVERYADIRRSLRPPHGTGLIGDIDTLIAATALDQELTLITTDTDFERVPGLKLLLLPRSAG